MENQQPDTENNTLPPEVKMNPLPHHSIFHLFRIVIKEDNYIAKVFPSSKTALYLKEKELLQHLNHPHILKPILSNELVGRLSNYLKSDVLLFQEVMRGNFLNYIHTNGAFSERISKFYINQLIDVLLYCEHQRKTTHPNLCLDNMLMNQDRNLVLCGWCNSCQSGPSSSISSNAFQLGELIINLVTSRSLFISKDLKSDPYGKFLSEKNIHKLWEQLEKTIKKIIKDFSLSDNIKKLVGSLLLKKIQKVEDLKQYTWLNDQPTLEQVSLDLQKQEKHAQQLHLKRLQREKKSQKEEQNMVKDMVAQIQPTLSRTNSRYDNQFIEEYLQCQNYKWQLHEQQPSDYLIYFPLFDTDLKVILAHLSARLSQAQDNKEDIIDPLLLLKKCQLNFEKDKIKMECIFGWDYDLVDADMMGGIHFIGEIVLRSKGNAVVARVEVVQAEDLNQSCVHKLQRWFEEILTDYA